MIARAPQAEERAPRVLVSVAAVAVIALDALYLMLIRSQGDTPFPAVTRFVSGYFAAVAIALVVSPFTPAGIRLVLRGLASGSLVAITVMTALSIGVAVLVAAVLCCAGTALTVKYAATTRNIVIVVVAIVAGAALWLAGLQIAWSFPTTF